MLESKAQLYMHINLWLLCALYNYKENKAMLEYDKKALANRLKTARDRAGVSNRQIADACNVSPQAVGGWIRTGKIAASHINTIASLLGVSSDWLLVGRDHYGRVGDSAAAYGAGPGEDAQATARPSRAAGAASQYNKSIDENILAVALSFAVVEWWGMDYDGDEIQEVASLIAEGYTRMRFAEQDRATIKSILSRSIKLARQRYEREHGTSAGEAHHG